MAILPVRPPPSPPPPDPGGADYPDQPIPYANKPFGFNHGYQPYGDSTPDRSLAAMAATGATIERGVVPWIGMTGTNASQPVSPEFLSTPMGGARVDSSLHSWDQRYLDLLEHDITPIIGVGYVPIWASTLYQCMNDTYRLLHLSQCPDGWWEGHLLPHPSFYPQWRAYVAAVARRYPQAIIEGPNEPDLQWTGHQAGPMAGAYAGAVDANTAATIQCQLYSAVRSGLPERSEGSVGDREVDDYLFDHIFSSWVTPRDS